ncbi:gp149 [Synechococcus phage syn9]|uniref:Gp149 n=1 Tax=Synechococcus phage syn9 TaxID=382359 RepID=Q0QZ76_BPSYS|nr:gp149 [Synechococcus phage syn9]ABA47120.1 gp149 [Synechococcus phage syn9]
MISLVCQTTARVWRLWAKALGEKDGRTDREADIVAGIRTFILIAYMVTNAAIVANAVRHWDNHPSVTHPTAPAKDVL